MALNMPGDGPGWPVQATHVVEANDTLMSIGEKYHTPWRTLADLNQLANRNLIKVGDTLLLPWLNYTVQPGDWLIRIATEHGRGTPWQYLAYYNNLEDGPDLIHPGDVIRIPV